MSAVLNAVEGKSKGAAEAVVGQVLVKGRLEATRRYEGVRYTRLVMAAPDAYSRPQVVEIRSKGKLGDQAGEEVTVTCRLGGFTRKPFRVTDKDTGETSLVTPVDMTLDLVE